MNGNSSSVMQTFAIWDNEVRWRNVHKEQNAHDFGSESKIFFQSLFSGCESSLATRGTVHAEEQFGRTY